MRALALLLLAALVAGCSGAVAQAPPPQDGLDLALVRSIAGNPPRSEVLLVDADGRSPGRVLASPEGVRGVGGLSWAPDGRLLLVGVVGEEGRADVFTVPTDGGAVTRLTSSGDIAGAVMAPDGSVVAVARQTVAPQFERSASGLWLVDAAGTEPRLLLPGEPGRFDLPGTWSPDGRQLAFTRRTIRLEPSGDVRFGTTIWVVNADGTEARRIAEGRSPAWSPDGTRIAFASARDRNGEIYGGDTRRAAAELYTAAPDGSDLHRITHTTADEDTPAWSGDGRWLAYERQGDPATDAIWTMRPDGTCARPMVRDAAGGISYRSPGWRPGTAVERACAGPARHAALPAVPVAGLQAARAFRGHPLYWLGPTWRGRRLVSVDDIQPRRASLYFHYADCRGTLGADCRAVWFQIMDVCTIPPPGDRGPLPIRLTRTRIRGAPAFLGFGQWEVYTGRVVIRVYARGRAGRQVIAALRGLNAPAGGLRPGRPFPPPIPGALERQLPCP